MTPAGGQAGAALPVREIGTLEPSGEDPREPVALIVLLRETFARSRCAGTHDGADRMAVQARQRRDAGEVRVLALFPQDIPRRIDERRICDGSELMSGDALPKQHARERAE